MFLSFFCLSLTFMEWIDCLKAWPLWKNLSYCMAVWIHSSDVRIHLRYQKLVRNHVCIDFPKASKLHIPQYPDYETMSQRMEVLSLRIVSYHMHYMRVKFPKMKTLFTIGFNHLSMFHLRTLFFSWAIQTTQCHNCQSLPLGSSLFISWKVLVFHRKIHQMIHRISLWESS